MIVSKDGMVYTSNESYNPTYEELINDMVNCFTDLGLERAKGIVDFLIAKYAITKIVDGKLYRTMMLVPRVPLHS